MTTPNLASIPLPLNVKCQSPCVVALQPWGQLDQTRSLAFQTVLENALTQATEAVIVDLFSVEAIAPEGIEVLKAGIRLAASLGKNLSFQAASSSVRLILEAEQNRERSLSLSAWTSLYQEDFDYFLGDPTERTTVKVVTTVSKPAEACTSAPILPAKPHTLESWQHSTLAS